MYLHLLHCYIAQYSLYIVLVNPCRLVREEGPNHAKTYVCSVSLKVGDYLFCQEGEVKSRRKDAEGSAALAMLLGLHDKDLL